MRRIIVASWLLLGCNTPTYLSERRPLDTQMSMNMAMNNGMQTDTDLYVLPVRRPSASEMRSLVSEQMKKGLPQVVPWAATRDFDIEIEWSMKNLETTETTAFLTLVGGNEFGDYDPNLFVNPNAVDQTPPPPLLGGSPVTMAAGEVRTGVFREDEIAKASLDLEAITRYPSADGVAATPFETIEHDPTADRTGLDGIPPLDVTPSMVRFVFGLSADGHVVCDYTVRVRDHSSKLAQPTDQNLYVSTTPTLAPPVPPMFAM
jgi:hypothetical protein